MKRQASVTAQPFHLRKIALLLTALSLVWLVLATGWATFRKNSEAVGEGPAVAAGAAGLVLALVLYLWERRRRPHHTLREAALTALHLGLLLALGGFLANAFWGEKGFVYLREGGQSSVYVDKNDEDRPLPFSLALKLFRTAVYPGTLRPENFSSDVVFQSGRDQRRAVIAVNQPADFDGWTFYQQSYGVEVGPASRLRLSVFSGAGEGASMNVRLGERFHVPDCGTMAVVDFVPTAQRAQGRLQVLSHDLMLAPAYLVEFDIEDSPRRQWVLASDPSTERLGPCRLHVDDFVGVRYAVLAAARSPFDWLVFLGVVLTAAACAVVMGSRRN